MRKTGKLFIMMAAFAFAILPLLSQTPAPTKKPAFDVISIKPSPPNLGIRGGGPRGNRLQLTGANLRMLLQQGFSKGSNSGPINQIQIIGGPNWMDSDRWDVQATVDCNGGVPTREQVQLMIQSMLEDRFQLKSHMETRELPVYNLVAGKDGPKIKPSSDQTPPNIGGGPGGPPMPCTPTPEGAQPFPQLPPPGQRGGPGDANFSLPRGAMMMMVSPTGMTMQATGVPFGNFVNMLQQQVGRPVIDKTDLKGLFDFKLTFSPEGLSSPGFAVGGGAPVPPPPGAGIGGGAIGGAGGTTPATAGDPIPSLFTAIQELGLKLESTKGALEVLVVDTVQKPTEN